ncbi:MAG: hypothetical protein E5Y73_27800 [Mesorhizobium sp.]|uniref:hypothetical protein n=1 Tax=Mesorhizobium sp. TaxID=1871066 RepID=UPI00120526CB|nr:hypothetical protein [Mesorhizobium sp.]TIL86244.1 MAG: hypothetical protein E5Y73_27800 [Mesorhizobium sp.]
MARPRPECLPAAASENWDCVPSLWHSLGRRPTGKLQAGIREMLGDAHDIIDPLLPSANQISMQSVLSSGQSGPEGLASRFTTPNNESVFEADVLTIICAGLKSCEA